MRVLLTQPIPAPYRAPLFDRLAEQVDLLVLYERAAETGRRSWEQPPLNHQHVTLKSRAVALPGWSSPLYLASPGRLHAIAKAFAPEVLVVGGWDLPTNWLLAQWGWTRHISTLMWLEIPAVPARWSGLLVDRARQRFLRQAGGYIAPGDLTASWLARVRGGVPVTIVPNCPHPAFLDRTRRPGPERGPIALFVGELSERKGVDLLLGAIPLFRRLGWRLSIVGDGPLRNVVAGAADAAQGLLSIHGHSSVEQLISHYDAADAVLVPSRYDPWPLVSAEAACRGRPLGLGNVGSADDLLGLHAYSCRLRVDGAQAFETDLERMLSAIGRDRPRAAPVPDALHPDFAAAKLLLAFNAAAHG